MDKSTSLFSDNQGKLTNVLNSVKCQPSLSTLPVRTRYEDPTAPDSGSLIWVVYPRRDFENLCAVSNQLLMSCLEDHTWLWVASEIKLDMIWLGEKKKKKKKKTESHFSIGHTWTYLWRRDKALWETPLAIMGIYWLSHHWEVLSGNNFLLKPSQVMLAGLAFSLLFVFSLQTRHVLTFTLAPRGPGFHGPFPHLCFFCTRIFLQPAQDSWPIPEPNEVSRNGKCGMFSLCSHFIPRLGLDSS